MPSDQWGDAQDADPIRGSPRHSRGVGIDRSMRTSASVDELGFAPLDDTGAQLLFRFVATAY